MILFCLVPVVPYCTPSEQKEACVTGGAGHRMVNLEIVASYLWPAFKVLPAPCVILPSSR